MGYNLWLNLKIKKFMKYIQNRSIIIVYLIYKLNKLIYKKFLKYFRGS